jgi:hypothetical protein
MLQVAVPLVLSLELAHVRLAMCNLQLVRRVLALLARLL